MRWSLPKKEICLCQGVIAPKVSAGQSCSRYEDADANEELWFIDDPTPLTKRKNWTPKKLDALLSRSQCCKCLLYIRNSRVYLFVCLFFCFCFCFVSCFVLFFVLFCFVFVKKSYCKICNKFVCNETDYVFILLQMLVIDCCSFFTRTSYVFNTLQHRMFLTCVPIQIWWYKAKQAAFCNILTKGMSQPPDFLW